jgi:hypothetical protein
VSELEAGKHVMVGCNKTKNCRMNLKCKHCLRFHRKIMYQRIVCCLRMLGNICLKWKVNGRDM